MPESLVAGIPYKASEWPHGLRCADCSCLITEPERYSERLTGFQDECPMLLIVCLECAVKDETVDN